MEPKVVHGLLAVGRRSLCALAVTAVVFGGCGGTVQGSVQDTGNEGGQGGGGEGGVSAAGGESQPAGGQGGRAGAAGSDAGAPVRGDDAGVIGGDVIEPEPMVPPGLVPVVVALGPGGRTAVSCNGGRAFRVNDFHKTPDDDHSAYAVTGLAGGFGAVIASAGWGAPGRVLYSENAVDWEELSASQFTKRSGAVGPSTESTSNAFFDGTAFNVFWGHQVWSSMGGKQWKETTYRPTNISHIRDVVFYPEAKLLLMRVERDENGGRTGLMMTSTDLGKTYKIWSPRTTGCQGFSWGPVAYSHGIILAGGSGGSLCRSEDGGGTWTTVPNIANVNAMFGDRSALYLARGDELLRSEDGVTWVRVLKANASLSAGVWSEQTGYAISASAGGQSKFFRSDDGKAWAPATFTGTSFGVRFMRTAFVKPSPKCPGL